MTTATSRRDQESSVLFELIARRYETRSLAVAANQPFSAWDAPLRETVRAELVVPFGRGALHVFQAGHAVQRAALLARWSRRKGQMICT